MRILYSLLIRTYGLGIFVASLFHRKAKAWRNGRKNWRYEIGKALAVPSEKTLWIHAASLGEFEQGRPLLEAYRQKHPTHRIVLTFFSPSGYEVRKDYPHADVVCYLPLDTLSNARDFIEILAPDIAIFIKYEFWFHHLAVLKERRVKTFLVSGRLHSKQSFFRSWGAWFRTGLEAFHHFFVLDQRSVDLLASIGIQGVSLTGDTRFDRVLQVVKDAQEIPLIEQFVGGRTCLILGSSWRYEEIVVEQFIRDHADLDVCVIIAPHEMDERRMSDLENQLVWRSARLSTYAGGQEAKVMFIDSIGLLSRIYRYGDVAFVGGGYGNGVHNILEPAAWGLPVVIGPRFEMFPEVVSLVQEKGALVVEEQHEVNETLHSLLTDVQKRAEAGKIAADFCRENAGATAAIMAALDEV